MTLSATPLEKILQAVNEKYGTSFEGWSQKPTVYEVGDTVPNWNAYDKIEMPLQYYAVTTGGVNRYAAGYLVNKVWHVYFSSNNKGWGIDNTGEIKAEMGAMDGLIPGHLIPKMIESGIDVESYVAEVVDWQIGDIIPDIEQYTFIS